MNRSTDDATSRTVHTTDSTEAAASQPRDHDREPSGLLPISRRATLGLLAFLGVAGGSATAAASGDDDDEEFTPKDEHEGLAQRVEALEAELEETTFELKETKEKLAAAEKKLENRSEALTEAFGNDFVEPGDTRLILAEESVAGIERGLAVSLAPDAFEGDEFEDKHPHPDNWSRGESFAQFVTGIVGIGIDEAIGTDIHPQPDEWFPDGDYHPNPSQWDPGVTLVDTLGGATAERLGADAFPGDHLMGSIERGLAVSMSPEEAFPGGTWAEKYPNPDEWEPGETFANVLALNLTRTIDRDHEFHPDPSGWFPDDEFHPHPDDWFPDEEGKLFPGETWIDAAGGVTAERVGEESFPGETWIESIEKGLTVSIDRGGFPRTGLDLDDETNFPDGEFTAGQTVVTTAQRNGPLLGFMLTELEAIGEVTDYDPPDRIEQ